MANRINLAMTQEYTDRLSSGPDAVAVDIRGLTVEEVSEFRNEAREKGIQVFVIKNSVARRVLGELTESADEQLAKVIAGPTALVYGAEEGLPELAKLVDTFAKKTKKLAVRGGFFERQLVEPEDVKKFKDIPDRQTLLSQTLATIIAPMTGVLAAANALLSAPAALTEALHKKKSEAGES